MIQKPPNYEVIPFPISRQLVIDSARQSHRKHSIYGLLEVDVTRARAYLRERKAATGESLSFTAFVAACLGRAVGEQKTLHAYRDWRSRLVLFDEVDIATSIEIELEGQRFPLSHIIRAANRRSPQDIHAEIRAIQADPHSSPGMSSGWQKLLPWFLRLPSPARNLFYRALMSSPQAMKRQIGTVQLTAVGMFGGAGGWAITPSLYTLAVAVGGIAWKPGVVDQRIEPREVLGLTLIFDHDIMDGAPAARFAAHFVKLLEEGYGLLTPD
jgi:pyruvate/2-oxoglutarate dehydrogenase complex dihydrolipoamide acyltransferase (E2) component